MLAKDTLKLNENHRLENVMLKQVLEVTCEIDGVTSDAVLFFHRITIVYKGEYAVKRDE